MNYMKITEYWSGKNHYFKLKYHGSVSYRVEGDHLVIRDYFTNEVKQRIGVAKFGSIRYEAVYDKK